MRAERLYASAVPGVHDDELPRLVQLPRKVLVDERVEGSAPVARRAAHRNQAGLLAWTHSRRASGGAALGTSARGASASLCNASLSSFCLGICSDLALLTYFV